MERQMMRMVTDWNALCVFGSRCWGRNKETAGSLPLNTEGEKTSNESVERMLCYNDFGVVNKEPQLNP